MSSLDRLIEPFLGPPEDCPSYLSLGTPLNYGDPHLGINGWFQGSVAGTVGITDVIRALSMSRVEPEVCPGHRDGPMQVVNVKTSTWARNRQYPMFVPVGRDHLDHLRGASNGESGRSECVSVPYVRFEESREPDVSRGSSREVCERTIWP